MVKFFNYQDLLIHEPKGKVFLLSILSYKEVA